MRIAPVLGLAVIIAAPAQEIRLTQIASGVSAPTDIQNAADGSGRLFVVQQNGLVRILRGDSLLPQPFLDIRDRTRGEGERGLLGLAFPPDFSGRRRFYVHYTDLRGDTTIARYSLSSDPDAADAGSEVVLLKIPQPFANHNGGQIRFGPDGFLYIGMGDGGSGGDPQGNGQNRGVLLGKVLRIDVESEPGRVVIPPGNPLVGVSGARPEVWAWGLRNPWKFSFDRATGDLWIADVGQDTYEEVNFQPAASPGGENYGWNRMEGAHCFTAGCSTQGLTLPVAEYRHNEGCSVTGGFVYRGSQSPGLRGIYMYGDYCSGRIWGIERRGTEWSNRLLLASGFNITTFGEDEAGEVYVANAASGSIYRVDGNRAPRLNASSVVNAASFAPGLTPGSLATVFAAGVLDSPGIVSAGSIPLPTSLAGVSVLVNGVAAPVHVVANRNGQEQVNFQAPLETLGRGSVSVVVSRAGQASASIDVPVLEVQPAIYASDGAALVVRNADYSLVTSARPLAAGEYAFVYATGIGPVTNPPATGAAAPLGALSRATLDVRVTIETLQAPVQFAGLAPGFVGVYQINFQVPAGVRSGSQDLTLSIAGSAGPPVKIPIQ